MRPWQQRPRSLEQSSHRWKQVSSTPEQRLRLLESMIGLELQIPQDTGERRKARRRGREIESRRSVNSGD